MDAVKLLVTGILDFLAAFLLDVFDTLRSILFDFIFNDLSGYAVATGQDILDFFYDKFGSSPVSINFLPFYIGFIFLIFVLKKVFSILG
ncbi:MAG: hypothetical protein IJM55_05640 [Ruminococcus sp.]|nr:hypothetical protein [Ruminococcus sp.]